MTAKTYRYTLDNINDIIFKGFDYVLNEDTLKIISELSLQVGSPDYVKTPIFQKRENPLKTEITNTNKDYGQQKRRKNNKAFEVNDDDWETLRTFQPTKMEEKSGIEWLDLLEDLEKKIVYYYLWDGLSFHRIGKVFGFTKQRAHQIYHSAINKLKEHNNENSDWHNS